MASATRLLIWVRPGSRRDALGWDPWRQRWIVYCRAPPKDGGANRSAVRLVSGWLALPANAVRWTKAGRSRSKELSVEGLTETETIARLRSHLEPEGDLEYRSEGSPDPSATPGPA